MVLFRMILRNTFAFMNHYSETYHNIQQRNLLLSQWAPGMDTLEFKKSRKHKKECCGSYRKKGKFCKSCPCN